MLYRTGTKWSKKYTLDSFNSTFYALFGYCWQISNYELQSELRFIVREGNLKLNIFLTDSLIVSTLGLDFSQHRGMDIVVDGNSYQSYFIELEKYSNYNPKKPNECREYTKNEYQTCVDKAINKLLTDNFSESLLCNPTWLGIKNACPDMNWKNLKTLNSTKKKELEKMLMYIMKMELEELKTLCKPPCTVTRANIRTGRSRNYLGIGNMTGVTFLFDKTVKQSQAMIGYDFSNFLVDLGSSVGLWFGISVIGTPFFY